MILRSKTRFALGAALATLTARPALAAPASAKAPPLALEARAAQVSGAH